MRRYRPGCAIAVSACLLGRRTRWDGGHRRDRQVLALRKKGFRLIPVCPEKEIGCPVPRPKIMLVRTGKRIRLLSETGQELTARMTEYAERRIRILLKQGLSGFILKERSPSCGLRGVKLYSGRGYLGRQGTGLFAAMVRRMAPKIPLVSERALQSRISRGRFIRKIDPRR